MIGKLGAVLKWAILLPVLAAVVLLAVANDQTTTIHLNPFDTSDPVLKVDIPFYQAAFVIFAAGVVLGGLITWIGQLRHRSRAQAHPSGPAWTPRREDEERRAPDEVAPGVAAYLPRPERR